MPQIIDVPGQGPVEFPDGMSDAQIVAAIKKNSMPAKQKPSIVDIATSPNLAGGPLAMAGRAGMDVINSALDKLAYGAGGKVTDVATDLGASPEVAAGAGYAANLGTQLAAAYGFGKLGAKAGKPTMEAGAKRVMGASIKPLAKDWETGKAARAIETLLKEDVSPNQAGLANLKAQIVKLESEVDDAIKGSTAMVNKAKVGGRLRDVFDKFRAQVNPNADIASIRKAWDEFKNHPILAGKMEMPVQTAQAMKRATDRSLGGKVYGELKGAEIEAQKALRRGLKEEIVSAVPQVAAPNARIEELLNATKIAQRRALMDNNKNVLGLAPIAPNTASMLAFLADRSPSTAAQLARLMYRNAGVLPGGLAAGASTPLLMNSGVMEQPPLLQWLNSYLPNENFPGQR